MYLIIANPRGEVLRSIKIPEAIPSINDCLSIMDLDEMFGIPLRKAKEVFEVGIYRTFNKEVSVEVQHFISDVLYYLHEHYHGYITFSGVNYGEL